MQTLTANGSDKTQSLGNKKIYLVNLSIQKNKNKKSKDCSDIFG